MNPGLDIDPGFIVLLGSLAVVTAFLFVWGIVRLFRAGHPVVGALSLFLPLLALLGFLLAPTPGSALYRKRQRSESQVSSSHSVSQSYHVDHRVADGLPLDSEDPTEELPVIFQRPSDYLDAPRTTVQPGATQRSGRRSAAMWVWILMSIAAVVLIAAFLIIQNRYSSAVRQITASVAELSSRAGSINDAWDTGEAPLAVGSRARRALFGETEDNLVDIVADTLVVSRQASDIIRPFSASRDRHNEFVVAVGALNQHAEAMLAGLRLPGRSSKEPRQSALAAYQETTAVVLEIGDAIAAP